MSQAAKALAEGIAAAVERDREQGNALNHQVTLDLQENALTIRNFHFELWCAPKVTHVYMV